MARMGCSDQVLPKHVKEAYRLLNKSVIRVDQDDNIASPDPTMTASQQTTKKSLKLSYEEYKAMAIMIVHYLKKKESEDKDKDITKKDVVAWYIEEVSNDIESQDEIVEKKQIVEKVLDKLAYNDNVLVPLNQKKGLITAEGEDGETNDNPILIVHPNYVEEGETNDNPILIV